MERQYIGKYVCYGNKEGGFCWGKIKAEIEVNTVGGVEKAFVLTERMTKVGGTTTTVVHHDKETICYQRLLDLKKDVLDFSENLLAHVPKDELFIMVVSGEINTDIQGMHGWKNMMEAKAMPAKIDASAYMDTIKEELSKRMNDA